MIVEIKNKYYCTVRNERIHCDQRYKWGIDARTPRYWVIRGIMMESDNDKQSRHDKYERREYEEWVERKADKSRRKKYEMS